MANTKPPAKFVAGETLVWETSFSDYPAPTWDLSYEFRSANGSAAGGFDVPATDDGSGFSVTVAFATTADLLAGVYYYRAFVTDGTQKFLVDSGQVEIQAAFGAATDAVDLRSTVKITLDNIEAMIKGTATLNQQEYQINNRSLKRYPLAELIQLHSYYKQLYSQELRSAKLAAGGGPFRTIHTRFTRPS